MRSRSLGVGRSTVEGRTQRSDGLQRFFSTFPGGLPALALLLLRIVAGGAAVSQGGSYLAHGTEPASVSWPLGPFAILSGIGLILGCFTPAAAAAVSITTLLITATWTPPLTARLVLDGPAAALVIVDAVALALLGPGAHSIDAYQFGRREIIIPRERR
jgi:putative oxidoreductase